MGFFDDFVKTALAIPAGGVNFIDKSLGIGGDLHRLNTNITGQNGVENWADPLNLRNAFKQPGNEDLIAQQQAQMQAELLRRSQQANLKDMQASQLAAQGAEFSKMNNAPGLSLNSTSAQSSQPQQFLGL